ncbi:MAG: type II toxin-antitoxin system prevent-host-death family antitoxin [Chloroflexota bacterium]|nr:type II toxin-antitoxin system prevent-host-death family antitoxin [Chloroflexota bacterium]
MGGEVRVGVRELKNELSAYLRRVNGGESVVVTDHGRPVARLVPPDLPEGIQRLIREGRLRPARGRGRLPRLVIPYEPGTPLLSDIVISDRG